MFHYTAVSLRIIEKQKVSSNIRNENCQQRIVFQCVHIYVSLNSTNPANSIITHKALRKYIRKFDFWATGLMTRKEKDNEN